MIKPCDWSIRRQARNAASHRPGPPSWPQTVSPCAPPKVSSWATSTTKAKPDAAHRPSCSQRWGAADCGEYRQAPGAVAQSLKLLRRSGCVSVSSEKETNDEKQAQHFGQCQMWHAWLSLQYSDRTGATKSVPHWTQCTMSTSSPMCIDFADNHAKRSCREHQNFGKSIGSQNANQHGDPHSPPRPVIILLLK